MNMRNKIAFLIIFAAGVVIPSAQADVIRFGSAPRGDRSSEEALYTPIAQWLSEVTGEKIEYEYANGWLDYQKKMVNNRYGLIFDGPAFVAWRLSYLEHEPIVRLQEPFAFVIVARKDNARVNKVGDLVGRTICAHASPNLGTLLLLSKFDNPARQPAIVEIKGWDKAYEGIISGKCLGTILPNGNLKKIEANGASKIKVLARFEDMPNQAFTVSKHVNNAVRGKIFDALTNPEPNKYLAKLLAAYNSTGFVEAHRDEYVPYDHLLSSEWQFSNAMAKIEAERAIPVPVGKAPAGAPVATEASYSLPGSRR